MLPILRTKTTIPPTRPKQIERNRLFELLHTGSHRGLTLIIAPAGFGKTTLAAAWAQTREMPVAWLSLQAADALRERFFIYLIQALQTIDPLLGQTAQALLQSGSFDTALFALLNDLALLKENICLVLDDFHSIDKPENRAVIQFFLDNLPSAFHLVIISRVMPELNLIRLRAQDEVSEIDATNLRFTEEEVGNFLSTSMGMKLSQEVIHQLNRICEGWPVGLQLAAIAIIKQPEKVPTMVGNQYIFEYLAQEVLQRESPEVQKFLIITALFDRFSMPLCEEILKPSVESPNSAGISDIFAYIEKANLFLVPLDSTWYRYHALFTDFLRKQMDTQSAALIYRHASYWFETNNLLEDAIHYATHAMDYERAAALLENQYISMLQRGEHSMLIEWIQSLPSDSLNLHPRLLVALGWANIIRLNTEVGNNYLDQAEELISGKPEWQDLQNEIQVQRVLQGVFSGKMRKTGKLPTLDDPSIRSNSFLNSLLHFNLGLHFTMTGDTGKAVDTLSKSAELAMEINNPLVALVSMVQVGENRQIRGAFGLAEQAFLKGIKYINETLGEHSLLLGLIYVSYGDLLREQNRLAEAVQYLKQGIAYCQVWQPIAGMDGNIALARLLAARGQKDETFKLLESTLQIAVDSASMLDDRFVSCHLIRIALLSGDLNTARKYINLYPLDSMPGDSYYYLREMTGLVNLRYQIASLPDHPSSAPAVLQGLADHLSACETRERLSPAIEVLILKAYTYEFLGDTQNTAKTLTRALSLGAQSGYIRLFADEGRRLLEILEKHAHQLSAPKSYTKKIMDLLHQESSQDKPQSKVLRDEYLSPLTRRELDILNLLALGRSNQEIAAERVLTLNTVKKHVANILSKLGVDNRTQAVLAARKAGWID